MSDQADYSKLAQLIRIATDRVQKRAEVYEKQAFVPADAAAGGGGGAPPMDPAMMGGGGMPMDPSMMGGGGMPMDPSMMGGAPPMDPSMMGGGGMPMDPSMMGGGGGGDPMEAFRAIIKEEIAAAGMGGGGMAGGGAGIKPKIDVNVEIMQMKKMLARLLDTMGVTIPASEMVATPDDLTQMAQGGGAAMGAPGQVKPASDDYTGSAYSFERTLQNTENTRSAAAALADILGQRAC